MRTLGATTGAKIPTNVFSSPKGVAEYAASETANLIRQNSMSGGWTVLAISASLLTLQYCRELVALARSGQVSLKKVKIFSTHEFYPIELGHALSLASFFKVHLLDAGTDFEAANFFALDGQTDDRQLATALDAYEQQIKACGGIDLLVSGIASNGRLGFNVPDTPADSRTGLRELCASTRHEAASDFVGLANTPTHGLSMGLATMLKARRALLLATTEGRTSVVKAVLEGSRSEKIPASLLQDHHNTTVLIDEAAASELTSVRTPWLHRQEVTWDWRLVTRLLFDASLSSKTPLHSLPHHALADVLPSLAAQGFPASTVALSAALTGQFMKKIIRTWMQQTGTVVVFSPHPDDAEIQLGGTILKLRKAGIRVVVAVMTSGNLAVWDADTLPIVSDINALRDFLGVNETKAREIRPRLIAEACRKSRPPGTMDSAELREIKTVIRQNESIQGLAKLGVDKQDVVFLRLPFYETGGVEKLPPTVADYARVAEFLLKYQPSLVFAAGDLSDPHGTHRVCLDVILEAAQRIKDAPWISDSQLLLYRGAWAEWAAEDMDLVVGISREELTTALEAMRCHKSQIPNALFPGCDERPFDVRAEQRKIAAGRLFASLGLGQFHAIEGFRRAALV